MRVETSSSINNVNSQPFSSPLNPCNMWKKLERGGGWGPARGKRGGPPKATMFASLKPRV